MGQSPAGIPARGLGGTAPSSRGRPGNLTPGSPRDSPDASQQSRGRANLSWAVSGRSGSSLACWLTHSLGLLGQPQQEAPALPGKQRAGAVEARLHLPQGSLNRVPGPEQACSKVAEVFSSPGAKEGLASPEPHILPQNST